MDFSRRTRVVCARGGNLLRFTVNRQSNQGLAVASPRSRGVRTNGPKEMDRCRFEGTRRVLAAAQRTAIVACACAVGVAHRPMGSGTGLVEESGRGAPAD